jgi:ABC-2 type transport system permease protein
VSARASARTVRVDEALRRAIAEGERPSGPTMLSAALTFSWRGLLKIKHVPEQLVDVTLTPILFTLMFTYLFGGALAGSPREYLQYLLPAIVVLTVLLTTVYSGVTLNTDVTKGVTERFRSLPISRAAPLVGPLLSDTVRYLLAAGVALSLGLALGFRPGGGAPGVLWALALLLVFAFALSWVFAALGLLLRSPNAVMGVGFTLLFPLLFMSNAFVDPATMPSWLEAGVERNPISALVAAERELMAGTAEARDVAVVLGAAAVLTAVFAPLTTYLYRRGG